MNIVILEANTLGADVDLSVFEKLGNVTQYGQSDEENTADRVKDANIIVVNKVPMNEQTLKKADHLKMIAVTATGTNIIDKAYTDKRGIAVSNVGGYSTMSVAQHTFALALYLVHKMNYFDSYVKSGQYIKSDIFTNLDMTYQELDGKTWGIIGLGNIGKKVAQIARVFGCRVIYYSTSGKNQNDQYERVDFDTICRESDLLSIHAPLNNATENLMNKDAFQKMKKSAVLINVGRGPIVNEEDLVEALENGEIAAAGLDVISAEPMREENPLMKIKDSGKLVVTPHIAWASTEARQRLVREVYLNIEAFLRGEKRNIV
ncbi:MAG: D-2-hydroxyacid dehydrogenase [Clostridiales bacterium]|nr:D-2-hydroxyacid dehydrogenase [Clostridiales bacterium]